MNPVTVSTHTLAHSPHALSHSAPSHAAQQQTRFADLPLQARLLLAVPRVRGHEPTAPLAERYVLDTLGRIIDAGPQRRHTIEAVNLLADVLLSTATGMESDQPNDSQWLSAVENLVLCVLCKVRSGHTEEANRLAHHWLEKKSVSAFNTAAKALCNSTCFKRGGPHVFTPSWSSTTALDVQARHCSVEQTNDLSLTELLLLNAIRLRMRTLLFSGINIRVVPLLRTHLALPKIESLLDAHLAESLQYASQAPDIRCLCCPVVSADEAQFLDAMAAFSVGDNTLITDKLSGWLPSGSVERLQARKEEFQSIMQQIGAPIPIRDWDMVYLRNQSHRHRGCAHVNEPPMIH